jgi:uncharacterized protein
MPLAPKSLLCLALITALAGAALAQDAPQTKLPRIKLGIKMRQIEAQVASTPQEREIGLMLRRDMPKNEGMIFIFEDQAKRCFWMKNTLIPLTAAFVDDDGMIVNLEDMQPQTLDSHCSSKPVRYVLEMNKGWFADNGIKAGTKLQGELFKPKK